MARDITLNGGEISVLKALGTSGSFMSGRSLIERLGEMEEAEIVDVFEGLVAFDYMLCDVSSFRKIEEIEKARFKINGALMRELKDALNPHARDREKAAPRRQRRG